jgi:integrase
MGDLLNAIAVDPVIGPREKEARRSAIRTLGRWLHQDIEDVPADYRLIKRELTRLNPVRCGVSNGRFANVRSLINRSFLAFRKDLVDTRKVVLLPEWAGLFAAVADPSLKHACGRFARWCSSNKILPAEVDQGVADRYEQDLGKRLVAARPRQAYVGMCRSWNNARARRPALWPQVRLDAGDRRNITTMRREQVEADYLADQEEMLSRFGSKLNRVKGFDRPYAPRTIEELRRILERLYTVAIRHHRPTPIIKSLADLVRVDVVRSILGHYLERFGTENTKSACKYAHFLYVVAKYWVKAPRADLEVLREHRTVLKPPRTGMADKNRAMLRLFDDPRIQLLLSQGQDALATFNKTKSPRQSDALALQLACAIELQTAAPLRPQNLASICLSRHLVWGREGKRETLHLVFPSTEVKNGTDLEFRLPPRVIAILKVYLARARPLLAREGNDYLFPGEGQHHKGPGLLSKQIAQTMLRAVGVRATGHQFRHLTGYIYLKDNPGGHEVVRRFLGHKRIETTIAFYAGMEQEAAIEHLDRTIESRRQRIIRLHSPRTGRMSPLRQNPLSQPCRSGDV